MSINKAVQTFAMRATSQLLCRCFRDAARLQRRSCSNNHFNKLSIQRLQPTKHFQRISRQRFPNASWDFDQVQRFSSGFSSDPYNEYRRPISPHLWRELQLENLHTHRRIDQNVVQQLEQEMQATLSKQPSPPPEYGPTGTWEYQFVIENGNRRYIRSLGGDANALVMDFPPEEEIHCMSLTSDESCIAYLADNIVDGKQTVQVRNIMTGHNNSLKADYPLISLEWGPIQHDGCLSLYLVGADQQGRPDQVQVCTVNPHSLKASARKLMYQSFDPAVMVDVQRTKGCRYVAIQSLTKTSNEVYMSSGPSDLRLVRPRQANVLYHLDVGENDDIVMLLTETSGEYNVLETSVDALPLDLQENHNAMTIATGIDHVVTDMDLFDDHLVLYENSTINGCQRICVRKRDDPTSFLAVPLPSDSIDCGKISPAGNIHFRSDSLRFVLESPVSSGQGYEFEFDTASLTSIGSSDDIKEAYTQKRIFVESNDGTQVPLSLIYQEDQKAKTSCLGAQTLARPVVLVGYGAYGEPMNLGYDPSWLPLLERGFVLAFAHTRGGGDLGKAWYHAGRRHNKIKAIEDFEACAMHVKDLFGGTLTAKAFSAGGVIVGAAMNRQPGLFDNVVLTNCFLDVYATMTNPELYLTAHEWDEYGNPLKDTHIAGLVRSYCPVSSISSKMESCPEVLLIGTLDDENVPYWNSTILAKKLRDHIEDKDKVFFHMEASGGHNLGSRRLGVSALELAFIIQNSLERKQILLVT